MSASPSALFRSFNRPQRSSVLLCLATVLAMPVTARAHHLGPADGSVIRVTLTEWRVQLTPGAIPAGRVVFEVTNSGSIPHAFEIEGRGLEKSIAQIAPGGVARLALELRAGRYETYCPIGKGSHKMLGMMNHLTVGGAPRAAGGHDMHGDGDAANDGPRRMDVTGGGPVIQILPGPYPFADSARAIIENRPADQRADLSHKAQMGPYSNNVATIAGDLTLTAFDRGATGDSVSGTAALTTQDGSQWRLVIDRVQTKDIPFNPRFGGVIMGLFYHGASGVHTPLVPTIQSSLALWAYAHLYKNERLVTDDAMVHIMLLSRTRRTTDWALDCWDCSGRPVEELQLQVTPASNTPPFEAPGGFLFVNWEKSSGRRSVP